MSHFQSFFTEEGFMELSLNENRNDSLTANNFADLGMGKWNEQNGNN